MGNVQLNSWMKWCDVVRGGMAWHEIGTHWMEMEMKMEMEVYENIIKSMEVKTLNRKSKKQKK